MSMPTQSTPCPFCNAEFPADAERCPNCHASAAWADLQRAADFAAHEFKEWTGRRMIHADQWSQIEAHYAAARATVMEAIARGDAAPADTGFRSAHECLGLGHIRHHLDAQCL